MKESNSKSSNRVKSKSKTKTNYSNLFNEFNNSPGKIKKSKNKLFSIYNTHTNIHTKKNQKSNTIQICKSKLN